MQIRLNREAKFSWQDIGSGPGVLIVDDCLAEPELLREFALGLRYVQPAAPDRYPGWKSIASLSGAEEVMRSLVARYQESSVMSKPSTLDVSAARVLSQHFSILSFDPATAQSFGYQGQCQHVDGFSWLATVLYLFQAGEEPDARRGTAFWRHRQSGLQHWLHGDMVQIAKVEKLLGLKMSPTIQSLSGIPYIQSLDQISQSIFDHTRAKTMPFSADESDTWERLAVVGACFNRMIVYPTFQIHTIVDTVAPNPASLEEARLTMNTFVDYPFAFEAAATSAYSGEAYWPIPGLQIS